MTLLTAAECREIAERKMGEALDDRRHGKELKATAQAWLVLAERIAQTEAIRPGRSVTGSACKRP